MVLGSKPPFQCWVFLMASTCPMISSAISSRFRAFQRSLHFFFATRRGVFGYACQNSSNRSAVFFVRADLRFPCGSFDGSLRFWVHVVRGWGASGAGVGCTSCGGGVHLVRGCTSCGGAYSAGVTL